MRLTVRSMSITGGIAAAFLAAVATFWPSAQEPQKASLLAAEETARVIVVAPEQNVAELKGGAVETLSDWAYYLNEFAASDHGAQVTVVNKSQLDEMFPKHTPIKSDYATIFLKNGRGHFCEGPVLEGVVYEMGLKKLDDPKADSGYEGLFKPFEFTQIG